MSGTPSESSAPADSGTSAACAEKLPPLNDLDCNDQNFILERPEERMLSRILLQEVSDECNVLVEASQTDVVEKFRRFAAFVDYADHCLEPCRKAMKLALFPIYMYVYLDMIRAGEYGFAFSMRKRFGQRFEYGASVFRDVAVALHEVRKLEDAEKCQIIKRFLHGKAKIFMTEKSWTVFRKFLAHNMYILSVTVNHIDPRVIRPKFVSNEKCFDERSHRRECLDSETDTWQYYTGQEREDDYPETDSSSDEDSLTEPQFPCSEASTLPAFLTVVKSRKLQQSSSRMSDRNRTLEILSGNFKNHSTSTTNQESKERSRQVLDSLILSGDDDEGSESSWKLFGEFDPVEGEESTEKFKAPEPSTTERTAAEDLKLLSEENQNHSTLPNLIVHDLGIADAKGCVLVCKEFAAYATDRGPIRFATKDRLKAEDYFEEDSDDTEFESEEFRDLLRGRKLRPDRSDTSSPRKNSLTYEGGADQNLSSSANGDRAIDKMSEILKNAIEQTAFSFTETDFRGNRSVACSMAYSHRASALIAGTVDGEIRSWRTTDPNSVFQYEGHNDIIWDLSMSPYDIYFASGSEDATAKLWTVCRKAPLRMFAGHWCGVQKIAFHPSGSYLATASADFSVRFFGLHTGDELRVLEQSHSDVATSLDFSVDGRYLAVAGYDSWISVWDLRTQKRVVSYEGSAPIKSALFTADGKNILSMQEDGVLNSYKFSTENCDRTPQYSYSMTKDSAMKPRSFTRDFHTPYFRLVRHPSKAYRTDKTADDIDEKPK